MKMKKPIPFEFVLEALEPVSPYTKPMFGCVAVYTEGKIILVLRDRKDHSEDNGVWIATTHEHHDSLQKQFPSMRSIKIFGPGITGWQVLPSEAADFEESVLEACRLVCKKDQRIGKTPKAKATGKQRSRVTF